MSVRMSVTALLIVSEITLNPAPEKNKMLIKRVSTPMLAHRGCGQVIVCSDCITKFNLLPNPLCDNSVGLQMICHSEFVHSHVLKLDLQLILLQPGRVS